MHRPKAVAVKVYAFVSWLILHGALWWLLTGGHGWAFGLAFAVSAAALSLYLSRSPLPLRLHRLPGFVAMFCRELLSAGWDVARRALHPRLPLAPQWLDYPLQSRDFHVRLVLSAMVGLLPGTLSSRFEDDILWVHVIDATQPWQDTVAALEQALANLLEDRRA